VDCLVCGFKAMKCPLLKTLLIGMVVLVATAMADETRSFPPEFMNKLNQKKQIHVATERKSGARSTAAPVWFGVIDNAIWFATLPNNHKARRVKRGSPMYISVEGKDGPFIKAKAEIVQDGAMAERLGEIYAHKYWIAWLGMFRPSRGKIESGKNLLIRLTPLP
jgi:general stress protein 26